MDLLTANDAQGRYPGSAYAAAADLPEALPAAQGTLRCDVCVVGGGFTGLSSALHLAQAGYDVVLLEAQRIGFGASGRNGGQVGQGQRADQDVLERLLGLEHARQLWQLARQSVELVREFCRSDLVHTDLQPGIIHAAHRSRMVPEYHAYVEHLREVYGYTGARALGREVLRGMLASPAYHGGILFEDAGHIDPLQFALGLGRMAQAAGVRIFEGSRVTSLSYGARPVLRTAQAEVCADYVVLGCNGYLGGLEPRVATRVMPINNYIVATAPMTAEQQESLIAGNRAVADSKFVVNYFRFSPDHRLLFGGTESYGYRFPNDIAGAVRRPLSQIFPQLADVQIDQAWGGTLGITVNRMPHFERLSGNVLSMSGYSGQGVALATLAGQIAAEAIAGQAERFDVMARVPTPRFPGGTALRQPLLVLGMLWFALRDRL